MNKFINREAELAKIWQWRKTFSMFFLANPDSRRSLRNWLVPGKTSSLHQVYNSSNGSRGTRDMGKNLRKWMNWLQA